MVPSHRACGYRRRLCSLSGYWNGLNQEDLLRATLGSDEDKVMAGGTPANPAAPEGPDGYLSSSVRLFAAGSALFPIIGRALIKKSYSRPRLWAASTKSWPGEPRPTLPRQQPGRVRESALG